MKKKIIHYSDEILCFLKKPFLLSLIMCAAFSFGTQRSSAQLSSISMTMYDMIETSGCMLPARDSITIYGWGSGTPGPTDSVTIHLFFGDGADTIFKAPISAGPAYYATVFHTFHVGGTYFSHGTATATGGATTSGTGATTNVLSDSCASLTGNLYLDLNSNCIHDAGEPYLQYMPVYVLNTATGDTSLVAMTDGAGHYATTLMPGSYVILANYQYMGAALSPSCPTSGSYSLVVITGGTYVKDFAFQCVTPPSVDMSATVANTSFAAGHDAWIWVDAGEWFWYDRLTCSALSATVTLTLDSRLSYVGYDAFMGPGPSSVSGSTLTWTVNSASDLFGLTSKIKVHCPYTVALGDTICNTVYVTPTAITDPNLSNNTQTICSPALLSFDPNGISVAPQGTGPQGYIANNTPLTYVVHFQNTGTAPATDITVNDTLDANLDMHTFHIFKSSAPVETYISGNVIKFKFNNINLPDSSSNPMGSIASVSYGILPKSGLTPGTQLHNKAGIYFDYNAPVMTNTTLNTIHTTTGTQQTAGANATVRIQPNPASNKLTITTENGDYNGLTITNTVGQVMATQATNGAQTVINVSSLPAGLYLLTLKGTTGIKVIKFEKL